MMLIFKAYGMLSSEMIFSCRVNCFCTCLLGELQGRQTMSGERSYVLLCHRSFFFLDNNERNWPCQLKESVFASTDKRRKEILPQLWNVVTFDLAIIFSTIIGRSFIVFAKKRFKLCLIWIKKFECVGFFLNYFKFMILSLFQSCRFYKMCLLLLNFFKIYKKKNKCFSLTYFNYEHF